MRLEAAEAHVTAQTRDFGLKLPTEAIGWLLRIVEVVPGIGG